MTKAQEMLAKAGFPDTKQGRTAFHKMYPTPDHFFKVHGNIFEDFPELVPIKLPIKPENVLLDYSPEREYYLQDTPIDTSEEEDSTDMYKSGGSIHIKPSKRGTFTAAAKKHGKSVQAFASQVLANKGNYSPAMVKKANFARNAAKWKHEDGGPVMYGDGGDPNQQLIYSSQQDPNFKPYTLPDTHVYSTLTNKTSQTSQNGNITNFNNDVTGASTQFDADGTIRNQYTRQTTNPNQTPYIRYFNNNNLGSEMHLAGPNGNSIYFTPDPMMDNFLKTRTNYMSGAMAGEQMKRNGGTVDALQLMGMPTPRMYGPGSRVESNFHPSLNLSTAINPVPIQGKRFDDVTFKNAVSNSITGSMPLFRTGPNQAVRLAGDYTYTNNPNNINNTSIPSLELQWAGGDNPGEGSNRFTPSRRFDNANIAHGANRGNLGLFSNIHAGISKVGEGYIPYAGLEGGVNVGIGRLPRSGGLPKGTVYFKASGDTPLGGPLNKVDKSYYSNPNSPIHSYTNTNASSNGDFSIGGSYNFNKGLSAYGEAGLRSGTNNSPRFELGLNKTFADGGHITHYIPSYNFGHVQSADNTYRHGFANGGPIGKYDFGSTIKDLGYGLVDTQLSTIGSLTGIKSMQDIVDADQYSNDKFDNVANFAGKVGGTAVKFIPGVGQVVGAVGAGAGALANTAFKIDEKNYDPSKHTSNWDKVGNFVEGAGNIASSFVNPMGAADTLSKGAQTAMNVGKIAGLGATGINAARDIDKSRGGTYDPTNLLNLGMGVANSGFFGGNMNTTSNYTGNTKGAVDYTPTMDTPLYAAMGGAVNAPNMMKYAQGGGVDMTEINVEHNELLTDENGKILTEYSSNALPPHPADGSMDKKGTVPAPPGAFVVTAALADKYKAAMKNNDKLHADAMRNNIAFDKQRKEAKQQAEQQAQQQMMQDMMVAKYGGMVRGYGYGGRVMKYDRGSRIPPIDESMAGAPGYYNYNSLSPIFGPGYNDPNADEYTGLDLINNMGFMPTGAERAMQAARNYNFNDVYGTPIPPTRVPLTDPKFDYYHNTTFGGPPPIETDMEGSDSYQYGDNPGVQAALADQDRKRAMMNSTWQPGSNYGSDGNGYKPPTPPSTPPGIDPNYFKYQRMLSYGAPAILGLEALLSKPFNMNAADYQIKGKVDPYEEEYIPDYRPYNAAVANLNRMPGSGNLAARTNLFNAMQQQQDDARYKISLANAQRKMAAQQANLGIEGQNLSTAMNIAQFNEQNRASRRNAIREQFGKNLPAVAYNDMANQMAMAGMSAAYPTYPFPWNKKST